MVDVYRTSPEIAAAQPTIAVLGVGAIEQHGAHLPVATDWSWIAHMTRRVAERLDAFWLPAIPFSMSECHGDLAGTVWLKPETLAKVIRDLVLALRAQGIHRIVIMNGHGGNFMLEPTIQELNLTYSDLAVIMPPHFGPADPPIFESTGEIHAGEGETSTQLSLNPELVKDERVDAMPAVGREFLDYTVMANISPAGVWGSPNLGSAEKGRRAAERNVELTARYVHDTFEAIAQCKQGATAAGTSDV
ncbi:MAG: creatininase family protein [Thermomicrobiales bacterium]